MDDRDKLTAIVLTLRLKALKLRECVASGKSYKLQNGKELDATLATYFLGEVVEEIAKLTENYKG